VTSNLLFSVTRSRGQYLNALFHVSEALKRHPFSPRLWAMAGEAYASITDTDARDLPPSGLHHRKEAAAFCLARAYVLLGRATTEGPLAKPSTAKWREELRRRVASLRLPLDTVDRAQLFASLDLGGQQGRADVKGDREDVEQEGDFEDLGRSSRLRAQEAADMKAADESVAGHDHAEIVRRLADFEREWLTFLVE